MSDFYFQIKGLDHNEDSYSQKWAWPPLFSGRVEAKDRKEARALVDEMFQEQFPCRVKREDNSKPFLLWLTEMSDKDKYLLKLFEPRLCDQCGQEFRQIDLYNNPHETYKGREFCSDGCSRLARASEMVHGVDDPYGNKSIPCIYRITNKKTGMVYIGQTRQAFTLRWWQHVKWGADDCKFHQALRESSLPDWTFEVIETCEAKDLDEREAHHIAAHDSVNAGYNSVKGNGVKSMNLNKLPFGDELDN